MERVCISPTSLEDVEGIYGRVISEPNRKSNRYESYSLEIEAVKKKGNLYSSLKGKILVVAPSGNISRGDYIYLEGENTKNYFLANGGKVIKLSYLGMLRKKLNLRLLSKVKNDESGNLILLLLTGNSLNGAKKINESVRSFGMSHLIALSGMHLGYISKMLQPLLSIFCGKRSSKMIKNILLLFFVFFCGMRPSLVRAYIFLLLVEYFSLEDSFILSLALSVKMFPLYTNDVATLLSFSSLSGILLFIPLYEEFFKVNMIKGRRILMVPLSSLVATLFSAPIVYFYFSSWQPYSFLISIFAIPILVILILLSLLRFIIPKLDVIIVNIISIIIKLSENNTLFTLSESFDQYYYLLSFFFLSLLIIFLCSRKKRTLLLFN